MDTTLILYILKVSVALLLFYGIYILFLKRDTFNKTKRYYLLFTVGASLLLPLCSVNLNVIQRTTTAFTENILPQILITTENSYIGEVVEKKEGLAFDLLTIIFYTLVSGMIFLFIKFIIQLVSILKIKLSGTVLSDENTRIILMDGSVAPFSFFNWIFLPNNMANQKDLDIMIAHEKIHSQQNHSFDIIISEVFCIFFWWNPVSWLIKKEIQVNLEYLADEGVLSKGYEPKTYQYLLLQITNSNAGIQIVNYFNVSQLKKRIIMINKEKSKKILGVKYLLVLPVSLMVLLINIACSETDKGLANDNNAVEAITESKTEIPEEATSFVEEKEPYKAVEVMPKYPGGDNELLKYISQNLIYPSAAVKDNMEGLVVVRFVVSETGKITNTEIIRSLSPECDAEAVRVVNSMPVWTPGQHGGENVPVYYTLPIRYKLHK